MKRRSTVRVNCYRLRHSFGVRLLLAGGNRELVQRALGHVKVQTTDFYTEMVTDPRLVDAVAYAGKTRYAKADGVRQIALPIKTSRRAPRRSTSRTWSWSPRSAQRPAVARTA